MSNSLTSKTIENLICREFDGDCAGIKIMGSYKWNSERLKNSIFGELLVKSKVVEEAKLRRLESSNDTVMKRNRTRGGNDIQELRKISKSGL